MGERNTYYERQQAAESYLNHFMSEISDGMAGDKTKVPSLSDKYEFKPPLNMHVRLTQSIHLLVLLPSHDLYCYYIVTRSSFT